MCLKPRSPFPHLIIIVVVFNLLDVRCSLKPSRSWNHEGPEEESFCSVASSFCQYFYSFLVPLIHFLDTVLLWHIKPFIECKELWVSASLLRELLPHRWDVFQFLTFEWVVTESGTTVFKRLNPTDNLKINASFYFENGLMPLWVRRENRRGCTQSWNNLFQKMWSSSQFTVIDHLAGQWF